ncbi:MAG: pentapeptide repeat-containing protein [Dorea sp.]|nr:pentapeptide repeat-containing protein [Dorea sp.]
MERITEKAFKAALKDRKAGERLSFIEKEIWNMDLSGADLSNMDFTLSSFQNTVLDGADFENSSVENALFDGCSMKGADFKNARMVTASFRRCDMRGCNIEDATLFGAVLEHADLEGIISNEGTKWFRLHCPEKGAFLGYKKCVNDRMVQLLIPADAKRTSATLPSCRCSKAKVLTIKSFDFTKNFEEAWSLVDENFVYKKGEWVEVKDFNEDRWQDSTTGIHFWMSRAEAEAY